MVSAVVPVNLEITKASDKTCAVYNEEIEFTVTIKNPTSSKFYNVTFKDELPPCLQFVSGDVDPNIGLTFDIEANSQKVIKFKAKATCRPINGVACNIARVSYGSSRVDSKPSCVSISQIYKTDDGEIWITPQYEGEQI